MHVQGIVGMVVEDYVDLRPGTHPLLPPHCMVGGLGVGHRSTHALTHTCRRAHQLGFNSPQDVCLRALNVDNRGLWAKKYGMSHRQPQVQTLLIRAVS